MKQESELQIDIGAKIIILTFFVSRSRRTYSISELFLYSFPFITNVLTNLRVVITNAIKEKASHDSIL